MLASFKNMPTASGGGIMSQRHLTGGIA
jgi:hypothetical protein